MNKELLNKIQGNREFDIIVKWLSEKKVPFIVKTDYKDNKPSKQTIVGITITKKGKFYRANGKIISKNLASYFI